MIQARLDELPAWLTDIRPGQAQAVAEILDAYARGKRLVVLEAPTGSGKSAIAEMVRMSLRPNPHARGRGVYVATTRNLQDQIVRDFEAAVLKGKSNYLPVGVEEGAGVTCADCTRKRVDDGCVWCLVPEACPYTIAKENARGHRLAVLNTAYLLAQVQGLAKHRITAGRDLVTIDECVLEGTRISTPYGTRRIEDIEVGDWIWGEQDGSPIPTQVLGVSDRYTTSSLVRVNNTTMTPNHPVWTTNGYVPSGWMDGSEQVAVIISGHDQDDSTTPTLRRVPADVHAQEGATTILLPTLCQSMELAGQSREDGIVDSFSGSSDQHARPSGLANQPTESSLQPEEPGQGIGYATGTRIRTPERGEWDHDPCSGTSDPSGTRVGLGTRTSSPDRRANSNSTPLLQDRPRSPHADDRDRSRRREPSGTEGQGTRSAKGRVAHGTGMDRAPVHKQGSEPQPPFGSGSDTGHRVLNLRTTTGNYFANGLLVHNCDELEDMLVGRAEIIVSERWQKRWGVQPLVKGARALTIAQWCKDAGAAAREWTKTIPTPRDVEGERLVRASGEIARKLTAIGHEYMVDQGSAIEAEDGIGDSWVRDYDDREKNTVMLKPVMVGGWGRELLWDRLEDKTRVLAMSATILDADGWCRDVGVTGVAGAEDWEWEVVRVPSSFPAENRPVYFVPSVSMRRGSDAGEREARWKEMGESVRSVIALDKYKETNTLVHTVSYALTEVIARAIIANPTRRTQDRYYGTEPQVLGGTMQDGRPVWLYRSARDRDAAVDGYTRDGGVLLASSLERGVDLADDACGLMIVTKLPFPNLGDRRVAARARIGGRGGDGDRWYAMQTARSLVQMSGRGVRHEDDRADTVVLDRDASDWYRRWKNMLPAYWRDAVRFMPMSAFMRLNNN